MILAYATACAVPVWGKRPALRMLHKKAASPLLSHKG